MDDVQLGSEIASSQKALLAMTGRPGTQVWRGGGGGPAATPRGCVGAGGGAGDGDVAGRAASEQPKVVLSGMVRVLWARGGPGRDQGSDGTHPRDLDLHLA